MGLTNLRNSIYHSIWQCLHILFCLYAWTNIDLLSDLQKIKDRVYLLTLDKNDNDFDLSGLSNLVFGIVTNYLGYMEHQKFELLRYIMVQT